MEKWIQKPLPIRDLEEEIIPPWPPDTVKKIMEAMASLLLQVINVEEPEEGNHDLRT